MNSGTKMKLRRRVRDVLGKGEAWDLNMSYKSCCRVRTLTLEGGGKVPPTVSDLADQKKNER
jgi:hypothetical protein